MGCAGEEAVAVGRPLNCIWTRRWSLEVPMVVDEWLASSMDRCGGAEYEALASGNRY